MRMGGYIYKLNLKSGQTEKLRIDVNFDNPNLIPYYKNVKNDIHSFAISPSGKRVLFDARGDIFSVPAENGITENLTESQGIREIFPSWSPDGKTISYYSDATGEYELYLLENKKGAKPRQVTFNSSAWKYQPLWVTRTAITSFFLTEHSNLSLSKLQPERLSISTMLLLTNSGVTVFLLTPDGLHTLKKGETKNPPSGYMKYLQEKSSR